MHFVSVQFLLFVALSLFSFHATRSLAFRKTVLFASNLWFVAYLTAAPRLMLPTAVFLVSGFVLVRLLQARQQQKLLAVAVVLAVASFVYLKRYTLVAFLPPLSEPYSAVGLSYLLFRIIHLMVDSSQGAFATPISFASYFNYCCLFPCWLSGPIQRYEDYLVQEERLAAVELSGDQVYEAFSRIVTGYFKLAIFSAVLLDWHQRLVAAPLEPQWPIHFTVTLGLSASLYMLYMYYNFAGYMDVVIGVGTLFGFRLPENFDRPFASGNFLELWSRWHITLSNWFKFYVFNASTRALAARWGSARSTPYLGVLAYFLTFSVMGVWHGSTTVFFLYGLFLGGGVSVNKLYEIEARRILGKDAFRRLRANPIYATLCRASVFAYFTAALVCFWANADTSDKLFAYPALTAAAYVAVTAAASLWFALGTVIRHRTSGIRERLAAVSQQGVAAQIYLGAKAYAVALIILMQTTSIPEFVYVPF